MKFLVVLCVLILKLESNACNAKIRRKREEFSSFESSEFNASPAIDSHATSANRVGRRNSFLPQQTPSNRNYFRDLISRNEGSNDNTIEYTIDPNFSSFLQQKQRKQQSEIHGGLPYKYTREVQTKQGRITGIVREMHVQSRLKNVDQFLGIPYAEAPVDSRRKIH